jgi:autonomous glycyl radical cofactor GrcA
LYIDLQTVKSTFRGLPFRRRKQLFQKTNQIQLMNNIKTLEQEKNELNVLINKGIPFEIEDIEFEEKRTFFGLIKRHVPVKVKRKFKIEEPTLGTLDRLSAEWIEFEMDEAMMKSGDGMQRARTLVGKHSMRCARIIALAVLGSDYLIPKCTPNGTVRYVADTPKLEELTDLFARTIKPSQLYQLSMLINAICNLGDFVNSIRFMCAHRTTMPVRIETNSEG